MTDSQLLNATVGLARLLNDDLKRFDTGDTWQRYLRLPDGALPSPAGVRVMLGVDPLTEALKRFDRTRDNPRFVQISSVPSFAATHAALAELVDRASRAGPATADGDSVAGRRVPPPAPTPPRASRQGLAIRNAHASSSQPPAGPSRRTSGDMRPQNRAEELPAPPASPAPSVKSGVERSIIAN